MPAGRRPANTLDLRDQPAYPLAEGARYLRLPVATLRAWTLGRAYPTADGDGRFQPLIRPASRRPPSLSFWNLIEAHVLRALRTDHGVSVRELRKALASAERELGIDRLLLSPDLRSRAGQVFLDRYGELINLSASGQLAMKEVLERHLARVEWDRHRFPIRLHPFLLADTPSAGAPIAIDPRISFGRPVLTTQGISTAAIADRLDAGESAADVAADYGITEAEVAEAVVYERAA